MNALPFISHHLFVAAIRNDSRAPERSARRERPSAGPADAASNITLEVMDVPEPMAEATLGTARARITRARI